MPSLSPVVFSRQRDDWETPADLFAALDAEFAFLTDAAATAATAKCRRYFGPDSPWVADALSVAWHPGRYFLNPPYSQTAAFIAKAAEAAASGSLVVCLVAARTDTRWWHAHVYDQTRWTWRPGVSVRLRKGRVRFVGATNSAPFPSAVIIFAPRTGTEAPDGSSGGETRGSERTAGLPSPAGSSLLRPSSGAAGRSTPAVENYPGFYICGSASEASEVSKGRGTAAICRAPGGCRLVGN